MKIICVGRNYGLHAQELGNDIPDSPVIFLKPETALLKPNETFYLPSFSNDIHHEIELVVKIDKIGKSIAPPFAKKYYSQVTVGIDFTARDLQTELKSNGLPWEPAKAFDHSAVVGRFVPLKQLEVQNLDFELHKNEIVVQKGNSKDMLFSVDEIISYVSKFFTLKTGDLIFTGTPAGVSRVDISDRLVGFLNNEQMFDIQVK